jgi:Tfp pilus assembly protein PilX
MLPIKIRQTPSAESGFALILALLALMLLTTMGLALSTSTSSEMQIATNHRWSEGARFNAEAGIEYGKNILAGVADWGSILPPVRTATATWTGKTGAGGYDGGSETTASPSLPPNKTGGTRSWENWKCDTRGYGAGYGVVFEPVNGAPEEYRTTVAPGMNLNGAFTLWVRRPVMWSGGNGTGNTLQDYPGNEVLILVSEGVAPFAPGSANTTFSAANRAVYTLEVLVGSSGSAFLDVTAACSGRQGQAGGSAQGTNSSGCIAITNPDAIKGALGGGTDVGTGALK